MTSWSCDFVSSQRVATIRGQYLRAVSPHVLSVRLMQRVSKLENGIGLQRLVSLFFNLVMLLVCHVILYWTLIEFVICRLYWYLWQLITPCFTTMMNVYTIKMHANSTFWHSKCTWDVLQVLFNARELDEIVFRAYLDDHDAKVIKHCCVFVSRSNVSNYFLYFNVQYTFLLESGRILS